MESNKLSYEEFATNSSEDEGFKELESNISIICGQQILNISSTSPNLVEKARLILQDHFSELEFIPAREAANISSGRRTHFTRKDLEESNKLFQSQSQILPTKISYDRDQLMSLAGNLNAIKLPLDWSEISSRFSAIVKTIDSGDQHLAGNPPKKHVEEFHKQLADNSWKKSGKNENAFQAGDPPKLTYKYEMLMFLARNRKSFSRPKDWKMIEDRFPEIVYKNLFQEMEVFTRDPLTNQDYIERRVYRMQR